MDEHVDDHDTDMDQDVAPEHGVNDPDTDVDKSVQDDLGGDE